MYCDNCAWLSVHYTYGNYSIYMTFFEFLTWWNLRIHINLPSDLHTLITSTSYDGMLNSKSSHFLGGTFYMPDDWIHKLITARLIGNVLWTDRFYKGGKPTTVYIRGIEASQCDIVLFYLLYREVDFNRVWNYFEW